MWVANHANNPASINPHTTIEITQKVLAEISKLHKEGVVHCDLKGESFSCAKRGGNDRHCACCSVSRTVGMYTS